MMTLICGGTQSLSVSTIPCFCESVGKLIGDSPCSGGEINLPDINDAVVAEWPGLFVEGWAETMEEEEAESFEYYVGVDLVTLDLSECMIVYY